MANTYTHRIVSLKKANELYLNTVKSFIIEVTASDGSNQISKEYKIELSEPNSDDFMSYEDLEESNLISWYENDFIEKDFITSDIDKKLQESIQDTVESNFPWS